METRTWWVTVELGKYGTLTNPIRPEEIEDHIARMKSYPDEKWFEKSRTDAEIILKNGKTRQTITYYVAN